MLLFRNLHAIRFICKECKVAYILATGSIVNDPETTEPVELLVEFKPEAADAYYEHFFSLQQQLAELLGWQTKVTDLSQLKNPTVKKHLLAQSESLLTAEDLA